MLLLWDHPHPRLEAINAYLTQLHVKNIIVVTSTYGKVWS